MAAFGVPPFQPTGWTAALRGVRPRALLLLLWRVRARVPRGEQGDVTFDVCAALGVAWEVAPFFGDDSGTTLLLLTFSRRLTVTTRTATSAITTAHIAPTTTPAITAGEENLDAVELEVGAFVTTGAAAGATMRMEYVPAAHSTAFTVPALYSAGVDPMEQGDDEAE